MKGPSVIFDLPSFLQGSEEWKPVEGHPDYAVSDQGRVWSRKREEGQLLTPYTNETDTYHVVSLYDEGERKQRLLHSLVAQHFKPGRWREYLDGDVEIHHEDEDPLNNRVENLSYVTREENEQAKHEGDSFALAEEAPF